MNIFALDICPRKAARAHCDQHLHKMILESAQIVSSVLHASGNRSAWLYKPTHQNHPCTIWAGETNHNLMWLLELASELEVIRQELNCPYHASTDVIKFGIDWLQATSHATSALADTPALAMPIEIKMLPNLTPYQKYQEYYRRKNKQWTLLDKRPMTWKNRPVPSFMVTP